MNDLLNSNDSIDSEEIFIPQPIILGIFGNRSKFDETQFYETILHPLLQEFGRIPDKILVPNEGLTSYYIQEWAEALNIHIQVFHADFRKSGKSAYAIRDTRIENECTHALVFMGVRSKRMESLSKRLLKKDKAAVFTISADTNELEQLEVVEEDTSRCQISIVTIQDVPPSLPLTSQASKHGRKSNKGKELEHPPKQSLIDFGIQRKMLVSESHSSSQSK